MRTARLMELCLLYLGVLFFAHFAVAAVVQFTVYALVPLFGSLTFFAFYLDDRRRAEEPVWPRTVVYLVAFLAVAYTIWFVAGLLSVFVLN